MRRTMAGSTPPSPASGRGPPSSISSSPSSTSLPASPLPENHLAADRRGRPLRVLLTPVGPGRPRSRPEMVIVDKAYSHPSTSQALRDRKIRFVSPERDDQIARRAARGSRGGRPPAFDAELYKQRTSSSADLPGAGGAKGRGDSSDRRKLSHAVQHRLAANRGDHDHDPRADDGKAGSATPPGGRAR